ncbi:MFS transporter [Microbacterium lushaniae]|nr:MFS transporter [Microbacterium lushaniae]KAA9155462.1 MFS transporter [Microbacterium lushaniae]
MIHRERLGGVVVGTAKGAWPARAVFFLNGLVCASYIASLPALKGAFRLDDGALGGVSFLFASAALVGMHATSRLTAVVGAGTVLRVSLVALPLLLIALPSARGLGGLLVAVGAFGAVHGAADAAMNVYAVGIERTHGRRLVSSCHAAWSASAVVASLAMGVTTAAGLDLRVRTAAVAAIALAGGVFVASTLTAGRPARPRRPGIRTRQRGRWPRSMFVLGPAGTALMVCEGGALAWGAVMLHDGRGASLALSVAAVTGFAVGQTAGRLAGDRLAHRYGPRAVFLAAGALGACGLAAAVLLPEPALAVAGFTVAGLGMSVLLPLLFSTVGRAASDDVTAGVLVTRFTGFAYAGILLGPAVIGTAAGWVGIVVTMATLVPLLVAVTVVAGRAMSRLPRT